MKIRPLHDRVVIKRMEEEKASPGGIIIPDSATEKPIKGEVIAVGNVNIFDPSSWEAFLFGPKTIILCFSKKSVIPFTNGTSGPIISNWIFFSFTVLFGKYSGTEVKVDSDELVVMKEDDIMAVID